MGKRSNARNLTHYLVRWSIDEWAETPQQAALQARKVMTGGGMATTIFSVKDLDANTRPKEIDIEVLAHKVSPDHPDHPWKVAAREGRWEDADRLLAEATRDRLPFGG